jgi:hypothetical protein
MSSQFLLLKSDFSDAVLQRDGCGQGGRSLTLPSVMQPVRCGWSSCGAKLSSGETCPCREFTGGMSASLCRNCGHAYSEHY